MGNIISSVVFGHRFEYSDPSFRKVLELDNEAVVLSGSARTQVTLSDSTKPAAPFPFCCLSDGLPHPQLYDAFPSLLNYLPGPHQTVHANYREIVRFLRNEVQKHQEEWNPEDPRDYIDVYLAEMEKVTYLHKQRCICLSSLFESKVVVLSKTIQSFKV